jgi:hypothetical protein
LRPLVSRLARVTSSFLIAAAILSAIAIARAPSAASAAPVSSSGPLLWAAPGLVDSQSIDGLACPSISLCVAVDHGGSVFWSTDPSGGPAMWSSADVDGGNDITGVSCPSTALCVAVDGAGDVITSQNPAGGAAAWTVTSVDRIRTQTNTDNGGPTLLRGISCPSTGLCLAVDAAGNAVVSTDPAGGAAAWVTTHIDTNASYDCTGTGLTCQPPLVGIACPSTTICAAVDFSGNLLTTTDPTGTAPWASTPTAPGGLSSLYGISCPSIAFCMTVDGFAGRALTVNPATPTQQVSRTLPDSLYGIWCESPSLCVASIETQGGISGLLGSFDPSSTDSTWSLSSLGGIDAVACPTAALCLAADDEGNVAVGVTTTAIAGGLDVELLTERHLPTIATLARTGRERLVFTTPIPAQVKLVWTVAGTAGAPVTIATASHRFNAPGASTLTVRLSRAGRTLFRTATRRLALTATATFTASTGSVTAANKLTFKHPSRHRRIHPDAARLPPNLRIGTLVVLR